MGTLFKILLAGAALFLVLGGPHKLKEWRGENTSPTISETTPPSKGTNRPAEGNVGTRPPAADVPLSAPVSTTFRGQPDNLITSLDWLEKNARPYREKQEARLTYYLLARSDRCHVDSLSECMQEKIRQAGIDPIDFQYTYFLDRVMLAGTGHLFWEGRWYFVQYTDLRRAGWTSGERDFKNQYYCSTFRYTSKKPLEFIRQHLNDESVFKPIEKVRYPNGLTASGQPAVDWHTVSVNPFDFPLSIPDQRRRESLTQSYTLEGKLAPQPRAFIVLIAKDGRMFLTEPMDTGSGVKQGWIDWRIGNSSVEIRYFRGIGPVVKAICYKLDDPGVTFEQVLAASKPVARK